MKEREYNFIVDVITVNTLSNKPPRIAPSRCHVTPKRIFTMGGSTFDRQTGKQIMRLSDRVWGTYRRRADPASIRSATDSGKSA